MATFDVDAIRDRIRSAAALESDLEPPVAADVAFHMTDWIEDLEAFADFCANPAAYSDEQVDELLTQFLIHVPNHVAAAAKLFAEMPVTDVFQVGSTAPTEKDE